MKTRILVVTGPTASGKTRLAAQLCRQFAGEAVSVDSRQVFRRLDIGTGKDLAEFISGGAAVPIHLIDIAEPGEEYNLKRFLDDARSAVDAIAARGRLPVVVGGSPLYLDALLNGYTLPGPPPDADIRLARMRHGADALREELARSGAPLPENNSSRPRLIRALEGAPPMAARARTGPAYDALTIAPLFPRDALRERIRVRLDERLAGGLVEEVQGLLATGVPAEWLDRLGLEYKHVVAYLRGALDFDAMRQDLLHRIWDFAKRQDSWFRRMEREGTAIHWLPAASCAEAASALANSFLAGQSLPPPAIRLRDILNGAPPKPRRNP